MHSARMTSVTSSSPAADLSHVSEWVFDLDNTLYPRECNLWEQVDVRITHYVMKVTRLEFFEARKLQKEFYRDHGTTLNGLMTRYAIDPDHFLNTVHDIDYSPVEQNLELVAAIRNLPGRKLILTNADTNHAKSVLTRLGGADLFEDFHDIRDMVFIPKPRKEAYEGFFARYNITPRNSVFFDDLEKNLLVPHEMGMSTVQVVASDEYTHELVDAWELEQTSGPHVHHVTANLTNFLHNLK
jgi:putative hydrolase of the HAD superfamily